MEPVTVRFDAPVPTVIGLGLNVSSWVRFDVLPPVRSVKLPEAIEK